MARSGKQYMPRQVNILVLTHTHTRMRTRAHACTYTHGFCFAALLHGGPMFRAQYIKVYTLHKLTYYYVCLIQFPSTTAGFNVISQLLVCSLRHIKLQNRHKYPVFIFRSPNTKYRNKDGLLSTRQREMA